MRPQIKGWLASRSASRSVFGSRSVDVSVGRPVAQPTASGHQLSADGGRTSGEPWYFFVHVFKGVDNRHSARTRELLRQTLLVRKTFANSFHLVVPIVRLQANWPRSEQRLPVPWVVCKTLGNSFHLVVSIARSQTNWPRSEQ